ncbi:MAG: ECF-type sigma factor [Planctomycetota bacterium]|jgi:RNA polymerase sigma factor (TIGR02999 family)
MHDDLTQLISEARKGDEDARDRLFAMVYDELRALARSQRHVGRAGETLQPTVLANEAYLLLSRRMPGGPNDIAESRRTFFQTVALAMREVLRDHWRAARALKRGAGRAPVPLERGVPDAAAPLDRTDFLALDDALQRLEAHNARWYEFVMHRYFAGRPLQETAEIMGMGMTTAKSTWNFARAWLRREMESA